MVNKTEGESNLKYGNAESIACEKTPGGAGRDGAGRGGAERGNGTSPFASPRLSVSSRLIATSFPGSLSYPSGWR